MLPLKTLVSSRVVTNADVSVELVGHAVPVLALFQVADVLASVSSGILRGQGRQYMYIRSSINFHLDTNVIFRSSYIQTPAYYAVAMPVSLSLAFLLKWEVVGLWVGVALALLLVAASQTMVVFMTRWDKVVQDAHDRTVTIDTLG